MNLPIRSYVTVFTTLCLTYMSWRPLSSWHLSTALNGDNGVAVVADEIFREGEAYMRVAGEKFDSAFDYRRAVSTFNSCRSDEKITENMCLISAFNCQQLVRKVDDASAALNDASGSLYAYFPLLPWFLTKYDIFSSRVPAQEAIVDHLCDAIADESRVYLETEHLQRVAWVSTQRDAGARELDAASALRRCLTNCEHMLILSSESRTGRTSPLAEFVPLNAQTLGDAGGVVAATTSQSVSEFFVESVRVYDDTVSLTVEVYNVRGGAHFTRAHRRTFSLVLQDRTEIVLFGIGVAAACLLLALLTPLFLRNFDMIAAPSASADPMHVRRWLLLVAAFVGVIGPYLSEQLLATLPFYSLDIIRWPILSGFFFPILFVAVSLVLPITAIAVVALRLKMFDLLAEAFLLPLLCLGCFGGTYVNYLVGAAYVWRLRQLPLFMFINLLFVSVCSLHCGKAVSELIAGVNLHRPRLRTALSLMGISAAFVSVLSWNGTEALLSFVAWYICVSVSLFSGGHVFRTVSSASTIVATIRHRMALATNGNSEDSDDDASLDDIIDQRDKNCDEDELDDSTAQNNARGRTETLSILGAGRVPLLGFGAVAVRRLRATADADGFRFFALIGRRGAGKSRIWREAFCSSLDRFRVVVGEANQSAGDECAPYGPWRSGLGELCGINRFAPASEQFRALSGASSLADDLSGISAVFGLEQLEMGGGAENQNDGNSGVAAPSAVNLTVLTDSVLRTLTKEARRARADNRRFVLVLEDMECADSESKALLQSLLTSIGSQHADVPLTLVVCVRSDATKCEGWISRVMEATSVPVGAAAAALRSANLSLDRILGGAAARGGGDSGRGARRPRGGTRGRDEIDRAAQGNSVGTALFVPPLSVADVRTLLRRVGLSSAFASENATSLCRDTQGNPLWLLSVLTRLFQEDDLLERATVGWNLVGGKTLSSLTLPSEIVSALETNLSVLEKHQLEVLQMASFFGLEFDACLLASALDMRILECVRVLSDIERRAHIVHDVREEDDIFRFSTGGYVDALRRMCGADEVVKFPSQLVRYYHQTVCDALCSAPARSYERLFQIADHALLAGPKRARVAFDTCVEAARRARAKFALAAAYKYAKSAIDVFGNCATQVRDHDDLRVLRERCNEMRVLLCSMILLNNASKSSEVRDVLRDYVPPLSAEARVLLALSHAYDMQLDEAHAVANELVSVDADAGASADDSNAAAAVGAVVRANALWVLAFCGWRGPDEASWRRGVDAAERCVDMIDAVASPSVELREVLGKTLGVLGGILEQRFGDDAAMLDRAELLLHRALEVKRDVNDLVGQSIGCGQLGRLMMRRYKDRAQARFIERAIELFKMNESLSRRTGSETGLLVSQKSLGDCRLLCGDYDEARAHFRTCLQRAVTFADLPFRLTGQCGDLLCLLHVWSRDEVEGEQHDAEQSAQSDDDAADDQRYLVLKEIRQSVGDLMKIIDSVGDEEIGEAMKRSAWHLQPIVAQSKEQLNSLRAMDEELKETILTALERLTPSPPADAPKQDDSQQLLSDCRAGRLRVVDLRRELQSRQLPTNGTKATLVQRLETALTRA